MFLFHISNQHVFEFTFYVYDTFISQHLFCFFIHHVTNVDENDFHDLEGMSFFDFILLSFAWFILLFFFS